MAREAPRVNHLFFADDSILFCDASQNNAIGLMEIRKTYELCSGQKINRDKSAIFFSPNTLSSTKSLITSTLQVRIVVLSEKYLGLPTDVGRSKISSFKSLSARVWKRLQGWKGKLLSRAGKEVLIKSVAQAIPTYSMSCFLLPGSLCDHLFSTFANFWWGSC